MVALFGSKGSSSSLDPAEFERLKNENSRLHRAVEELSVLNEIALAINSTMTPEAVNELIVSKCVRRLGVEQGAIHMLGDTEADPTRTLIRVMQDGGDGLPMRIGLQVTGWMHKNRRPLVVNDLATDTRFSGSDVRDLRVKSLLSVPLELKGRLIGILNLFNKTGGEITNEDARLAAIIASQCAQVIENARLYTEEQKLQRLQEDVRNATVIQEMLLPQKPPSIPGADLAGVSHPARDVGGDYFDFIDLGEGRWGIAVGDVSGKGLPAALLMANLQAVMRGCAITAGSVADCVAATNHLLVASTDSKTFVTLFYAVFDGATRTLTYCNAGHNPPMRLRVDGSIEELSVGGPISGAFSWATYEEAVITLDQGEHLVIYTDGVTEAEDPTEEQFGEKRLAELIQGQSSAPAQTLIDRVVAEVLKFQQDAPVMDDITVVCLRT
ncbi:MAG TPA: GAF domain-containing SpoIIE family protein phosphatase [Acidobacteriota bacterium]|nr:GAF domain-containing SpoIIE family protein phosphatase [Acidobacteriota bacterium]